MARKSVTEMTGGVGQRQLIWQRIRLLSPESDFALKEIVVGKESIETARDYLVGLERAGYLELVQAPKEPGKKTIAKRWKLVRDNGIEAPRVTRTGAEVTQGLAQEQMWRTLRMLTSDTNARELAAHASTAKVPVAEVAAKDYLKNLLLAGYLERTAEGKGKGKGGMQARYRLRRVRNTGPRPPMVCRTKVIYDPNLGEVVWVPPVTEEDAVYGK